MFKSNRWVEVCCKRCRSPLGEGFIDRGQEDLSSNVDSITTFKFLKSKISCSSVNADDGSINTLPTRSMSHYFVRELIETANAHANYRFILLNEENLNPVVALWVLNWKVQAGFIDKDGKLAFTPAMKILYKRIKGHGPDLHKEKEYDFCKKYIIWFVTIAAFF